MNEGLLPPFSEEAEIAVLSAMLQDTDTIPLVLEKLDAKSFYRESHQKIFQAIFELYEKNKPVDIVTLTEYLRSKGELEDVGGVSYLSTLFSSLPSTVNVEHYVGIVKEKAILRGLMKVGRRIMEEAQKGEKDVERIIDQAEKEIFDLAQRKEVKDFIPVRDLIMDTIKVVENLVNKKELVTGVPTGFHRLDFLTTGFHPGELIVVAGRPGMGKSSFVLNIALHVALDHNMPVAIFSLEMDASEIARKLLCMEARVDLHRLRQGFIDEDEWPKLSIAAGRLHDAPLFIDDTPSITPLELRAKARRLKKREGIKLLIVDYLQLMRLSRKVESRQQEIAEISFSLKSLAKELGIPVIAVSQLSRRPEERSDNRPRLSDLRESGAIEQDADVVILLYRRDMYEPEEEYKGICEVNIAKQRNGPTDQFNLHFIKEYTRFEDITYVEEGYPGEE
ncbi:MAG TPA: replicative DNA helicase [bacterium]|nr:replicative DNA helicase [bacterium]HEX68103.1 replicative DNA helicase [bacterium]